MLNHVFFQVLPRQNEGFNHFLGACLDRCEPSGVAFLLYALQCFLNHGPELIAVSPESYLLRAALSSTHIVVDFAPFIPESIATFSECFDLFLRHWLFTHRRARIEYFTGGV